MNITRLAEFFQDTGTLSATRLVYISWSLALLGLLGYLTIKNGVFPKIDTSMVFFYATIIAGKVTQSFAENGTTEQH